MKLKIVASSKDIKAGTENPHLVKGQVGAILNELRDTSSALHDYAKEHGDCGENMKAALEAFYNHLDDGKHQDETAG